MNARSPVLREIEKKEKFASLHGSPKWITIKNLRAKGFSWNEIDFAFFSMTLFGEARNLKEHDIEMVARVINNRRKSRNYRQTVTDLAQFSTWYYKNQRDNVNLLCPHPIHNKNWKKVVRVAIKMFHKDDTKLGSTHYFAPHNMVPKYRLLLGRRGNMAPDSEGISLFLKIKTKQKSTKTSFFYIPEKAKRVRIRRGQVKF